MIGSILDGALIIDVPEPDAVVVVREATIRNESWGFIPCGTDAPVITAMRGYTVERRAACQVRASSLASPVQVTGIIEGNANI